MFLFFLSLQFAFSLVLCKNGKYSQYNDYYLFIDSQYQYEERTLISANQSSICYAVEFSGRFGNLLFEFAAIVGVCEYHKKRLNLDMDDIESCAVINEPKNSDFMKPVQQMVETFQLNYLPADKCKITSHFTEHAEDIYGVRFDPNVFKQPSGDYKDFIVYINSNNFYAITTSMKI